MAKPINPTTLDAIEATDWDRIAAMSKADVARQITANPDTAPALDVRAIRRATGLSEAEFARAYEFSVRTVQEWERGAKSPSGPARTLLRDIKGDSGAVRKAFAPG